MTKPTPPQILVATDFSDGSEEAIAHAIDLAKQLGASLEILHVIELGVEDPFGGNVLGVDHRTAVDRMLERLVQRAETAGLVCMGKIVDGNAAAEIPARARQIGARLIVVGTHGRTGLAHVVMGSIAERVVRHAACPVLTVPYSKKAAA
jgi:nucleotide-binding universal stress UspA family protein